MYQFLDTVQYWVSNQIDFWNDLPATDRASITFVGGVVLVYLCIKEREVEYSSIAMGLGALLMFAYTLAVTMDVLN